MTTALGLILSRLDCFVLVFLRVGALVVSSPIFGRRNVPQVVKTGLCLCLSYIVLTSGPEMATPVINGLGDFVFLAMKELLFGLIMGFTTTLFFSIPQTAGYVIDMQMGFGMVNVFDVQSNLSVPVTGNFFYIMLLMCFFAVNGHHRLIEILLGTFYLIPVGEVVIDGALGLSALEVFVKSFLLAVNVAMPMIASGMLGEVILGFIVRTTPQMNVFVVGIPLKILLGFMILIIVIPVFANFSAVIFDRMYQATDYMIGGLAGD